MISDSQSAQGAITTFRSNMTGKVDALRAKYAQPQTWGTLYADADNWWRIATQFREYARELSQATPAVIAQADDNALYLMELRAWAHASPADKVIPPEAAAMAIKQLPAPIEWLSMVGTPALQRSVDYQKMVEKAVDAPGKLAKWTLDQFRISLGLPKWFVPVAATTVLGGLAWWAYTAFLKPVGRLATRTNPSRKRRRRRGRR